jgi:hypothetical protein
LFIRNDCVKIARRYMLRAFSDETLAALDVGFVKLPCPVIDRVSGLTDRHEPS